LEGAENRIRAHFAGRYATFTNKARTDILLELMRVAMLEEADASVYHRLLTEHLRTAAGRASGPQRNIVDPAGHPSLRP